MKLFLVLIVMALSACSTSSTKETAIEPVFSCVDKCEAENLIVDKSYVNVCACKPSKESEDIKKLQERVDSLEKHLGIQTPSEEVYVPVDSSPIQSEDISIDELKETISGESETKSEESEELK